MAEAVLIDVDAFLLSQKFDFVRWVDDFYFFTGTEQQAQIVLIDLAERLYDEHGLTLSALKTKILPVEIFSNRFEVNVNQDIDERLSKFLELSSRIDPYSDDDIDFSEA